MVMVGKDLFLVEYGNRKSYISDKLENVIKYLIVNIILEK